MNKSVCSVNNRFVRVRTARTESLNKREMHELNGAGVLGRESASPVNGCVARCVAIYK